MTMSLVSTVTVGAGGAASIEWTGIPQTGTDLLIVCSLRQGFPGGTQNIFVNGVTSVYSSKELKGSGSGVSSTSSGSSYYLSFDAAQRSDYTSNTFNNISIYIPNYTSSAAKTFSIDAVTENNATASQQVITAGATSSTSAISSLNINGSGSLVQYSTASLYTITKGSGGATVS